ncbi:hypothetical protein [Kamptonema formosum]|nr:hypothetical protein [Oscillatoria sp. PCC 10802]
MASKFNPRQGFCQLARERRHRQPLPHRTPVPVANRFLCQKTGALRLQ